MKRDAIKDAVKKELQDQLKMAKPHLNRLKHTFRQNVVEAVEHNFPPAYRRIMTHSAQMHFKYLDRKKGASHSVGKIVIEKELKEAGFDTATDEPYQKVLGLEGGKAAFKALKPK